jgi:hypothetical protein
MGGSDCPPDETEKRSSDEHPASDRSVPVDRAQRADGRSKPEANRSSD